jgi:hypothetical protein
LTAEPTVAAYRNYEREIERSGRTRSVEDLQYWLAREAVTLIDLWRKFGPNSDMPALNLKLEDLIASPRKTLEGILSVAGVGIVESDMATALSGATDLLSASPAISTIESEAHFARPSFAEFAKLIASEAEYYGYEPWQTGKPSSGPVTMLYRACRANNEKRYDEVVSILTPLVGTTAVATQVRAMLGRALLEIGSELDGRRAMEIVLRLEPDYLDGYILLAEHAYELGLNIEARGYLREAATRKNGNTHVRSFLDRTKLDPELAGDFPAPAEPFVDKESVVAGYFWILGRMPESDAVIDSHSRLGTTNALRTALLRSDEFKASFERLQAGQAPQIGPEQERQVRREDIMNALHWLLNRPLRSRDEAGELLAAGTMGECRLRLLRSEEFRELYRALAEAG